MSCVKGHESRTIIFKGSIKSKKKSTNVNSGTQTFYLHPSVDKNVKTNQIYPVDKILLTYKNQRGCCWFDIVEYVTETEYTFEATDGFVYTVKDHAIYDPNPRSLCWCEYDRDHFEYEWWTGDARLRVVRFID